MDTTQIMVASFWPRCRFCHRKFGTCSCNSQGTDYNKAVLELSKKEVING